MEVLKCLTIIQLILLVLVCCKKVDKDVKAEFKEFKKAFRSGKKAYKNLKEDLEKFKVFAKNSLRISRHNERNVEDEEIDFAMDINQFADFEDDELTAKLSIGNIIPGVEFNDFEVRTRNVETITPDNNFPPAPAAIDWSTLGHVSPVKDQGSVCNSCWAFSAVAALESHLSMRNGFMQVGSEQNLIDCNRNDVTGNWGCNGGSQASAYMYSKYAPGLMDMASYPYKEDEAHDGYFPCQFNSSNIIGSTTGYVRIQSMNETLLKEVVGNVGPVAFAMNANIASFWFYSSGIYSDPNCTPGTGHSALIYGYGTARYKNGTTVDYWLCKNSWSVSWGIKGFFRMLRGKNVCGLATYLIYPLV